MNKPQNTQPKDKPGRVQNIVLDQGQRKREEDRFRDAKKLQDHKHELNLERDKKKSITPSLTVIITLLTFAFIVFSYYKWL